MNANLQDLLKAFAPQLDKAIPSTGVYEEGKSFDQHIKAFQLLGCTFEQAKDHLADRIEQWQRHKGERLVFYVVREDNVTRKLCRVWESELPNLANSYKPTDPSTLAMLPELTLL